MPPAPYHHGNLRTELLRAAAAQLEAAGISGLSLRELARQLGVSHTAPQKHFPDKKALLDALAVHGLEQLGAELDAGLKEGDGSFDAQLLTFARSYVDFATRQPQLLALMFARKDQPGRADLRAANDAAFAAPSALIDGAIAAGEIRTGQPDQVALAVLATLQGLAAIISSGMIGDRPPEQVIADTIGTLARGLRNDH